MQITTAINPYHPDVKRVAAAIEKWYGNSDSLKALILYANNNDEHSKSLLLTNDFLRRGAERLGIKETNEDYGVYITQVAFAQGHIRRQYNEIHALKLQIKKNFPEKQCKVVYQNFNSIYLKLEDDKGSEINFLNYVIDVFEYIYSEKQKTVQIYEDEPFDLSDIYEMFFDILNIDSIEKIENDLTSGQCDFVLDSYDVVDVKKQFQASLYCSIPTL